MAQVFAPGVAQLRLVGAVGANSYTNVVHWYWGSSSSWTQGAIQTLATTGFNSFKTHFQLYLPPQLTIQFADATDLTDSTLRFSRTTVTAWTGTATTPASNLGSCVCVSLRTQSRYRGGHGRVYIGPVPTGQEVTGDTLDPGYVSQIDTSFRAWQGDINTALTGSGALAPVECVPRYGYDFRSDDTHHKWLKEKSIFKGPNPVVDINVSNQLRTQRRRLGP